MLNIAAVKSQLENYTKEKKNCHVWFLSMFPSWWRLNQMWKTAVELSDIPTISHSQVCSIFYPKYPDIHVWYHSVHVNWDCFLFSKDMPQDIEENSFNNEGTAFFRHSDVFDSARDCRSGFLFFFYTRLTPGPGWLTFPCVSASLFCWSLWHW